MRWLIFLSRVAFLSGMVMLVAYSLLYNSWNKEEALSSAIIAAGYALALIVLPVVNLLYLVFFISGKKHFTPQWLVTGNIVLLFILCLFIFYIHDPYYHQ